MERDFKGIWIPKELYENTELSHTEKFLLLEIDSLSKTEKGCFVSNARLGEYLGKNKQTVANLISGLIKKGYLTSDVIYKNNSKEIERRYLKTHTRQVEFIYEKVLHPIHENGNTPITKKSNTPLTENGKDNNTSSFNENICAKDLKNELKNEFEKLWNFYPNKKGKSKAEEKFIKHRKKCSYEEIEKGLLAYNSYIKAKDISPQFIKHGSTWFGQKSWEDDYTTTTDETQNQNTYNATAEWERVCEAVRKFGDDYWQDAQNFLGADVWGVITGMGGWGVITSMTDYNHNNLKCEFLKKCLKCQ